MRRALGIGQRQRRFDFGPPALGIRLAPASPASCPSFTEMACFVRRTRSAGLDPLRQLLARVNYAICDRERLEAVIRVHNQELDHGAHLGTISEAPVAITDDDLPF